MRRILIPLLMALAACSPPKPVESGKPAVAESVGDSKLDPDLLLRWRGFVDEGRYMADYSKSETDAVWYRMDCQAPVLVLTEFHASLDYDGEAPPVKGGGYFDLILREKGGRDLASATAQAAVVKGDLEMRFHLPPGTFDLADSRPNLELGVKETGSGKTGWTRLNDVARDVLMACAQG